MAQTIETRREERLKPLRSWQERVNATAVRRFEDNGDTFTVYRIGGQLAIVQVYKNNLGWELFVASSNCSGSKELNSVSAALDGAAVALGVEGCRGLVGPKD